MTKVFKALAILGAAAGAAVIAAPATAAPPAATCGVTGTAIAPGAITYDPFSSSGLTQIQIPLTLTRFSGSGGQKTQQVNFVLTKPVGSPAYDVTWNGSSVLYTVGNLMGHPTINFQGAGEINYNFGGAAQPDVVTLPTPLVVTIPAGVDLSAGLPIEFDIVYVCDGTGGMTNVSVPTTLPNAVTINVNVLSALQASYVGATLDFDEVGDKTTAEVLAAPASYTTSATTNNVRVASSGPYRVEVASDNGYRLTFPGGNLADPMHRLDYKAGFLGQTMSPASPSFTQVTCLRAGISGVNLPIQARLMEGGSAKTPAGNYSDVITVTISPLLSTATGQQPCPAIALPPL